MDKEELIKFEEEIAELFNGGNIFAPVHLYNGNEDQIINVFKKELANAGKTCNDAALQIIAEKESKQFNSETEAEKNICQNKLQNIMKILKLPLMKELMMWL